MAEATAAEASRALPAEAGDRPPSTGSLWLRLMAYARPYWALVAVALLFAVVFAGGRYGRAYLTKPLLDDVLLPSQGLAVGGADDSLLDDLSASLPLPASPRAASPEAGAAGAEGAADGEARGRDADPFARFREILAIAVAIMVALPIAIYVRTWCFQYVMGRVNIDVKQDLASKLMRMPLAAHRRARSGETVTRLLLDVDQSLRGLELLFLDFGQALAMVAIGVTTLFVVSWQLALLTLLGAPPIVILLGYFARKVRRGARRRQEQLGEVTHRFLGILAGIKVIKAFRGERLEEEAFRRETQRYFRRSMRVVQNRVLSRSLAEGLNNAIGIGVLMLGAVLVMRGEWGLSVGDVTAFAAVLATTYRPIKTLSGGWPQLMESAASAERFFDLLDAEEERGDAPGAVDLTGFRRRLRFDRVSFAYESEPVLREVSLDVSPGEVVAIVGPTGSGKSTLLDLLLRFHDPDSGSISIDDVDVGHASRRSLLDLVALVSQEPFLFDTTIRENVLYARPDAGEDELREACRVAHLDEFVHQLPAGLDTPVGELGLRLSGGQRQRITIARAILKRSPILLFDEATSALDARTERDVQDAIEALRGERTVLVVAHRLSTVRRADRIVVLEHGSITQTGSHAELLARDGLYRDLVALSGEPATAS